MDILLTNELLVMKFAMNIALVADMALNLQHSLTSSYEILFGGQKHSYGGAVFQICHLWLRFEFYLKKRATFDDF